MSVKRKRLEAWMDLVSRVRALPHSRSPELALERVNDFFNSRIRYEEDALAWGQEDYWATPLETVTAGRGDCEDIAIAKYFTLLQGGLPPERLKLHFVMLRDAVPGREAHVVLTFETADRSRLVLDNLSTVIKPLHERADFRLILEFDRVSVTFGGLKPVNASAWRRWAGLLERSSREGMPFDPVTGLSLAQAGQP